MLSKKKSSTGEVLITEADPPTTNTDEESVGSEPVTPP